MAGSGKTDEVSIEGGGGATGRDDGLFEGGMEITTSARLTSLEERDNGRAPFLCPEDDSALPPETNCFTDSIALPTPLRLFGLSTTAATFGTSAGSEAVLETLTASEHFCLTWLQRVQRPGFPTGPWHRTWASEQRWH